MKCFAFIAAIMSFLLASPVHLGAVASAILQPPKITILHREPRLARGLIFVAPKTAVISDSTPLGPLITDDQGRPVWFTQVTNGQVATDFRVQLYQGRPVLTWAQKKDLED